MRTMSDWNGEWLTRRGVLAGVAGTAGVGLVGGAGTRAFLRDTEAVPGSVFGNPYEGARVDLQLGCGSDACTPAEDGDGVSFAFEGIEPGSGSSTVVCPGLDGASEPAWLWFRAAPRTEPLPLLAEELTVTLAYADGTPVPVPEGADTDETDAEDISLRTFFDAFAGGAAVPGSGAGESDDAFAPDEERCLELSWSLPEAPDPDVSGQSVEFALRFAAVQYRADAAPRNPWEQDNE